MREWYQREDLSDKTVLDEKHLNGMLYDKAPQEKTYEGKFQFLNKLCRAQTDFWREFSEKFLRQDDTRHYSQHLDVMEFRSEEERRAYRYHAAALRDAGIMITMLAQLTREESQE